MNVIRQADKAGVTKIIVTSSIYAVWNPQYSLTDKGTPFYVLCTHTALPCTRTDWNPVTKEEALSSGNAELAYAASKKFSELAVWDFADTHPHIEFTISTSRCAFYHMLSD
jgi:nucleoside-diphosphate-sugar epimerase